MQVMYFEKITIIVVISFKLVAGVLTNCERLQVNETEGVIRGPEKHERPCWKFQPPNQNENFGLFIQITNFNFSSEFANFYFRGLPNNLYNSRNVNPTCLFWSVNKLCLSSLQSFSPSCPDTVLLAGFNGSLDLIMYTPRYLLDGWENGSLTVEIRYQFVKCNKTCKEDVGAPEQENANCRGNTSCTSSSEPIIIIALSLLLGLALVGLVIAIYKLRQASKHHHHHQPVTVRLNDSDHAPNRNGVDQVETPAPAVYAVVNKKSALESNNDVSSSPEKTITDVYAVINKESA